MGRKPSISKGDKFGKLTVKEVISRGSGKHAKAICDCECGKTTECTSYNLKRGKHCDCEWWKFNDYVGEEFGKIKVVKFIKRSSKIDNKRGHLWKVKCRFCDSEYEYQTSALTRDGFKGCSCNKEDPKLSSKKSVYCQYKKNAEQKNLKFNLSLEEFINICNSSCYYCGVEDSNEKDQHDLFSSWKYNGIDRVDNSKGYIKDNCVAACFKCNKMKSNYTQKEFLKHVERIYNSKIK